MNPVKNIWLVFLALIALRLLVGFHFFNEGYSKIQSGKFTCAGFLSQAKGPFAKKFKSLINDHDGKQRLCVDESGQINTEMTFAIWDDFVAHVSEVRTFDKSQKTAAANALKSAKNHLGQFLADNQMEILAWVAGQERLTGFQRDGESRLSASRQVQSLQEQVETINLDRKKTAAPWFAETTSVWDELESRVNEISGLENPEEMFSLSRPFDQAWSSQNSIDRFLPWFDLTVGLLLIFGLLVRPAAIAGIGLLLGVVLTQPFWVAGTQSTFYQWIEIGSLFVLFATSAGLHGGLDYFLSRDRSVTAGE